MLNQKKIRWMTRANIYEKREGIEDFRRNEYFLSDYVRSNILINVICVTIAYMLMAGIYCLYNAEHILTMAAEMKIGLFIREAVLIYVLILIAYIGFGILYYSSRYSESKKRLRRYYRMLKLIERYGALNERALEEEDNAQDSDN